MSSLTGQADNLPQDSLQELKIAYQQAIKYAWDLNEEIIERKRVEAVLAHRAAQLALINDIGSKNCRRIRVGQRIRTGCAFSAGDV